MHAHPKGTCMPTPKHMHAHPKNTRMLTLVPTLTGQRRREPCCPHSGPGGGKRDGGWGEVVVAWAWGVGCGVGHGASTHVGVHLKQVCRYYSETRQHGHAPPRVHVLLHHSLCSLVTALHHRQAIRVPVRRGGGVVAGRVVVGGGR